MKKHSKRIISSVLSITLIVSTLGVTLSNAANDVKVKLVETEYYSQYGEPRNYYMKTGTEKRENKFNQTQYNFYKNALKAGNYFYDLGFRYNNRIKVLNPDRTIQEKTSDTVYLAISYDDGKEGSTVIGRAWGETIYNNDVGNSRGTNGLIIIGLNDPAYMKDFAFAPDVIAHEYAHLITQQIAGWDNEVRGQSNEAGAVVEAYSDILGELSEGNPDWQMGTDAFLYNDDRTKCLRNIKNPKSTVKPISRYEMADVEFYTDFNEYKSKYLNASYDGEKIYSGSTVLSYAAYLMTTTGLKNELIAKIWLDSLYLFDDPSYPTFSNCRKAVIAAAEKYAKDNGYSKRGKGEMLARVRWAFDSVNVY